MAKYVVLLRGINVGTAKQVPMAQFAEVLENLGAHSVKTVLRSGNAVVEADAAPTAASVEQELLNVTGVQASALVLTSVEFTAIARANPLQNIAADGSRLFVTFLSDQGKAAKQIAEPDADALAPEALRITDRAVYQWFPDGSLQTKVPKSFWRQFTGAVTARNANTIDRLLALLE